MAVFLSADRQGGALPKAKAERFEDGAVPLRGQTVYYSEPKLISSATTLGQRHYSYRFAADKFLEALTWGGADCVELQMPEYYGCPAALQESARTDGPASRALHLIFRSSEEFRLLKFAYNIACFAWEFEILNAETKRNGNLLENQVHMLGICDEIWAPCSFTGEIIQRYGVREVQVVPAPIPVKERRSSKRDALAQLITAPVAPMNHNPQWRLEDSVRANGNAFRPLYEWLRVNEPDPDVFISVLNPEDHRKNMNAMLRGFHYYHQKNPNSILLVKLVTSLKRNNIDPAAMMYQLLANKLEDNGVLQSPAILFIADFLLPDQLEALYQTADFYLCTSIAEGQNLPMLEAMAYGAIPISPCHTAMLDYLDDGNSIAVAFRRVENFIRHIAPYSFGQPFAINYSNEREVFVALEAAGRLTAKERLEMSANAVATVRRLYGTDVILKKIASRFAAISTGQTEAVI
jgi:glycosyltransferase involved in cell wall biosynthesis